MHRSVFGAWFSSTRTEAALAVREAAPCASWRQSSVAPDDGVFDFGRLLQGLNIGQRLVIGQNLLLSIPDPIAKVTALIERKAR